MSPDAHPLSASLRGGESDASYEILGKLAMGGMAELFLARKPATTGRLGPVVVLKRILPHLAEDPEFVRMFRDEAYLAATLRHPNIVQVFDIGKQDTDYFFTMEYVHGENLRAILRAAQKRGESIPLPHILTIALGITAALHHAHQQTDDQGRPLHIVHRDVSPTNVLVAYDGSVKIVDFGIAKAAAGTHVTQAGMLKGKASYMSPEQCRASKVDRRSDVFAIGILLYEMTTLTRLFKGENELAILHQVLSGTVEPPSQRRPGYPPELERIVLKALAADPAQRYATAEALQGDLMRYGQQNGIRPSNPALGQFLRGLFGDKPLPWANDPRVGLAPRPPQPGPPPPPAGPRPEPGPGPGSRGPAAKTWRPGGRRKAPPPPPPPGPSTIPRPAAESGPESAAVTHKRPAVGHPRTHAASRPTAPRGSGPGSPPPPAQSVAYAPPPPDYELDAEESKTALAPPKQGPFELGDEAKTKVAGTNAADVAAFIAAAPPADLASDDHASTVKTQVAPQSSANAVAAFIAAAPPPDVELGTPTPVAMKTQIAPATAAELKALDEATQQAAAHPQTADLFNAPAAPTRRTEAPLPSSTKTALPTSAPTQPRRPGMPDPSSLPPPGGAATGPTQDTVMSAPAQPAALGGARRQPPPRSGLTVRPDLDGAPTVRVAVDTSNPGPPSPTVPASPAAAQLQPIAQWQQAPVPHAGHTMPTPVVDFEDEPLVIPGRNTKMIAMVVTVVVGLSIGALGVWVFLVRT